MFFFILVKVTIVMQLKKMPYITDCKINKYISNESQFLQIMVDFWLAESWIFLKTLALNLFLLIEPELQILYTMGFKSKINLPS